MDMYWCMCVWKRQRAPTVASQQYIYRYFVQSILFSIWQKIKTEFFIHFIQCRKMLSFFLSVRILLPFCWVLLWFSFLFLLFYFIHDGTHVNKCNIMWRRMKQMGNKLQNALGYFFVFQKMNNFLFCFVNSLRINTNDIK